MKYSNLFNEIRFDIKQGIIARAGWFLMAVLVSVVFAEVFFYTRNQMITDGRVSGELYYMDAYMWMFRGMEKYNPQAGLFTQSTKEILGILEITGGHADKIVYGAGDLYVTVFGGRTRRIGTLLGRGLTYNEAAEILKGVTLESVAITQVVIEAIRKLEAKNKAKLEDFPLLLHIYDIITKEETVNIPWKQFCETEEN